MVSTFLMWCLIVEYLIIAGASAFEGNQPRTLYFFSASLLTIALLWGTQPK